MKAIVVGMDQANGIGANNDMPWHQALPDDLARFRQMTTGNTVIMGRKTYETIGRPLANRENIVVSREQVEIEGVKVATSLEEAYSLATHDIYVMGGGQIYALAINDMDVLYVTEVQATFPEATIFFPTIDMNIWQETSREHHEADERNKYAFDFVTYKKE